MPYANKTDQLSGSQHSRLIKPATFSSFKWPPCGLTDMIAETLKSSLHMPSVQDSLQMLPW